MNEYKHLEAQVKQMEAAEELKAAEAFYNRVCARAEANMLKTGKLEGSHFAAMKVELADLREKAGR